MTKLRTAILVVLLLALAGVPAAVGVRAWMRGAEAEQSINYISREIHELSASRRRAAVRRKFESRSFEWRPPTGMPADRSALPDPSELADE